MTLRVVSEAGRASPPPPHRWVLVLYVGRSGSPLVLAAGDRDSNNEAESKKGTKSRIPHG